ncbi:MAG: lipoyl(octanoyl) transferase LipB [Pseudomonadota bacterium]|nr:lipoyl(octanoyl) transferase LipB [Pseudomonadota bacterium]
MKKKYVDWKETWSRPVDYEDAVETMESRIRSIRNGTKNEQVWLLEHPSIYTAGASAHPSDLLDPTRFPVYQTGRGGKYTYHGPGQLVGYVMLDLMHRNYDTKKFIFDLEQWIIDTLMEFGVEGKRRQSRIGIWVEKTAKGTQLIEEAKIAAIGVRIRRWVTYHGISLNIKPDLKNFSGIIPCGVDNYGVTSLDNLGIATSSKEVAEKFKKKFKKIFDNASFEG